MEILINSMFSIDIRSCPTLLRSWFTLSASTSVTLPSISYINLWLATITSLMKANNQIGNKIGNKIGYNIYYILYICYDKIGGLIKAFPDDPRLHNIDWLRLPVRRGECFKMPKDFKGKHLLNLVLRKINLRYFLLSTTMEKW